MKTTQAWGWLAAAALAAGLNASYHDGGLAWAHRIADNVGHNSAAVLALASGRADKFLTEARLVTASDERAACPFAKGLERMQSKVVRSRVTLDQRTAKGLDLLSARQEVRMARWEVAQDILRARIEAQADRLRAAAEIRAADLERARVVSCSWSSREH
jgi:hypothetical protein